MSEIYTVGHYGLHTVQDGVTYLVQNRVESDNFVGLPNRPAFTVKLTQRLCPHLFQRLNQKPEASALDRFSKIIDDPLVRDMLPIPKEPLSTVSYYSDTEDILQSYLLNLARLGSPLESTVLDIEDVNLSRIMVMLGSTNLGPLVLTRVKTKHQQLIEKISQQAQFKPRKLILIGYDEKLVIRYPIERKVTDIVGMADQKFWHLPMEQLGTHILRKFARGEALN